MKLKSVKQEPILKQFYLYFLVAAVIPFIVFLYLIFQFPSTRKIDISNVNFRFLLFMAALFSVLGFLATRSFILKIATLSKNLKDHPLGKMDKSIILELAKGDEEVAQLARVFSDIVVDLEGNVKELRETKNTLYQVLSKIGKTVGLIEDFNLLISFILETIVEALGAKRGVIFFLKEGEDVLRPKAIVGIDEKLVPAQIKIGEEAAGWVAKEKKSLTVHLLEEKQGETLFSSPLIAAPLAIRDKVLGAICISGKRQNTNFTEEESAILLNLAYQIAVSFENITLNAEFEKIYFETISALALAVEAKDPYSRGHSEHVAQYAVKIGEYLGLSADNLNALKDTARLHDIGKIGITDEILHKPGKLNDEEWVIMKKHPEIGEGIVKPLRSFRHIISPLRHHHEFLDGSGYPDGLKGNEIPLIARILTVVDIFDAMTSNRPYRKAFSIDETKKELEKMVQLGKIDNNVVNTLFKLIEEKKI